MANMQVSQKGVEFIARHEGFVGRTYLDPVGVPTLGYGFTNGSAAVRRHLGPIKTGMTITKTQARKVLKEVINEEYGLAANRGMKNPKQHEFDMGCSGAFNLGPRIFGWSWCKLFNEGKVYQAAERWRTTGTTAKGIKLPGLVRRRKEEADLLRHGDYGFGAMPSFTKEKTEPAKPDEEIREYQEKLIRLGYNLGEADGWMGPNTATAVRKFQKEDGNLKVDGKLSRATMQSIDRQLNTKQTGKNVGVGTITAIISSVVSFLTQHDVLLYVGIGVILIVGGYVVIKYRKKLEDKLLATIS